MFGGWQGGGEGAAEGEGCLGDVVWEGGWFLGRG